MHHFRPIPPCIILLHNQELGKAVVGKIGAWADHRFRRFTDSIPDAMLAASATEIGTGSTPSDEAAVSIDRRKNDPPPGAVCGLNKSATRLMPGAISLRDLEQ